MRVVLAASDAERVEWLAGVLQAGGFSVAVVSDPTPNSPELRGADLVIVDRAGATALAGAGPDRRMLIAPRDGTVELNDVASGFRDVLAIPASADEVVARVRYVLEAS